MKTESMRARLKNLMAQSATTVAPGAYNPMTALQIQAAGFHVAYIGSYTLSTNLGIPDLGLLDLTTMCARLREICDVVDIPVVADAESGFFNAGSLEKAIRAIERTGVSAIHIEDHLSGKHTSLRKTVQPVSVMVQKIRAALDAREAPDFQIIARTDVAYATGNLSDAVDRMLAYLDAGADAVMPSAITVAQLREVRAQIPGKVVLVNAGNASVAQEQEAGVDLAIYNGLCLQAAHRAVATTLQQFRHTASIAEVHHLLADTNDLDRMSGYSRFEGLAQKYGLTQNE